MNMILSKFLDWVHNILGKRPLVREDDIPLVRGDDIRLVKGDDIQEDIIVEILSRLSVEEVVKYRRVCKKWCALTLTPSFADLHLKRGAVSAFPSIFLQKLDEHGLLPKDLCYHISDAELGESISWKKTINFLFGHQTKRLKLKVKEQRFHHKIADLLPAVSCSCDGLLAFIPSMQPNVQRHVCILNPITKELVRVEVPFCVARPSGIYRDPYTREYKLLLITTSDDVVYHYYTAGLETMILKKLEYASSWSKKASYPLRMIASEGSLHWFVAKKIVETRRDICNCQIMVFNTKTEGFRVLPHPGNESICRENHSYNIDLLETGGKLWLFRWYSNSIQAWVLEDNANWAWNRRYTVGPSAPRGDWCPWEYLISGLYNCGNQRLVTNLFMRGVFWYNHVQSIGVKTPLFDIGGSTLSSPFTKTLVRISPLTTSTANKNPTVLKFKFCS